jgi:hypothetical protein
MLPMNLLAPHRLRAAARRVWCLMVAVIVVCGFVHAKARYFYCEALGLSATDPCVQASAHRHSSRATAGAPSESCPGGALDRAPSDCCQILSMPSVPEGARSVEPTVPAAGVGALLPAVELTSAGSWSGSSHAALDRGRWRGPPRSAGERRAQLMVFLT